MRPIPSNNKKPYEGNTHRSSKNGGSRGYSGGYLGGGTPVLESSGPEGKIRGTARQIADRYLNMARDALSSGDYVSAEGFSQHAEHYLRLVSETGGGQASSPSEYKKPHRRYDGSSSASHSSETPSLASSPSSSFSPSLIQPVDAPVMPSLTESPAAPVISALSGISSELPLETPEAKKTLRRPRRYKKVDAPDE